MYWSQGFEEKGHEKTRSSTKEVSATFSGYRKIR
jgi:hypothetical protein